MVGCCDPFSGRNDPTAGAATTAVHHTGDLPMSTPNPLRFPEVGQRPIFFPRSLPLHDYLGDRWVSVDISSPVWAGPCCYTFSVGGVVVYVGSTINFRSRLYSHRSGLLARIGADTVSVKIHRGHRYGDWLMREARLIKRLRPANNVVGL